MTPHEQIKSSEEYENFLRDIAVINREIESCARCMEADFDSGTASSTTCRTICDFHWDKKIKRRKEYDNLMTEKRIK